MRNMIKIDAKLYMVNNAAIFEDSLNGNFCMSVYGVKSVSLNTEIRLGELDGNPLKAEAIHFEARELQRHIHSSGTDRIFGVLTLYFDSAESKKRAYNRIKKDEL